MEKSTTRRQQEKRFGYRLLKLPKGFALKIFFAFLVLASLSPCFAQTLSPSQISALKIRPQGENFFTNNDCQFTLQIPNVEPQDVMQERMPTLPEGISFVSSRRMDYLDENGRRGTQLEFWFLFRKTGNIKIPSARIRINSRFYNIEFESVTVYEDPKTIQPRVVVELISDGKVTSTLSNDAITSPVGKTISFIVYVQYAVQIRQFTWDLPKDALFTEVERYEITKGVSRDKEFTPMKIPVAKFEYTPIKEGTFYLPNIRMVATAYNGGSLEMRMPYMKISVVKDSVINNEIAKEDDKNLFAYAFTSEAKTVTKVKETIVTADDCKKIAMLRSQERHRIPLFNSVKKERIATEEALNIQSSGSEMCNFFFYAAIFVFVIFTLLSLVLWLLRKRVRAIVFTFMAAIFAFASVFSVIMINQKYAIVKGGSISPVPEQTALSTMLVTPGNRVRIMKETSDWYYVEYNKNFGWINKDFTIVIE